MSPAFISGVEAAFPQAAITFDKFAAARLVGEHDTRIWRVLHHYVDQARRARDHREVRQVGIDETASRRRFHYVSLLTIRSVASRRPGF